MVAVVEHYAEATLVAQGSDGRRIQKWDEKETAWAVHFGVQVRQACSQFIPMMGFYEARTAVMHSRGTLTDAQRRSPRRERVDEALAAVAISRRRRSLVLSRVEVERCEVVCSTVLGEMEDAQHPDAESVV